MNKKESTFGQKDSYLTDVSYFRIGVLVFAIIYDFNIRVIVFGILYFTSSRI